MIGFIDSGIGGGYVLKKCLEKCPDNQFVYLADNKNMPFGNKTKTQLQKIAESASKKLIDRGCGIIVFACNTLTASAIKRCRKLFPQTIFIGIEPAILPAARNGGKNLVLLTQATYKFSRLVKKNKKNEHLIFYPQKNLADDIEKGKLKPLENYFKKEDVTGVVLGCTHYNFIKENITSFLGVATFYEASDGVAKRLESFAHGGEEQKIEFIFTGEDETKKYIKILQEKKA